MFKFVLIILTMPLILFLFSLFLAIIMACNLITEGKTPKQTYYSNLDDLFGCIETKAV
jgi:uncharacterized membrane protein YvlD (DUF360 family)